MFWTSAGNSNTVSGKNTNPMLAQVRIFVDSNCHQHCPVLLQSQNVCCTSSIIILC